MRRDTAAFDYSKQQERLLASRIRGQLDGREYQSTKIASPMQEKAIRPDRVIGR